MVTTPPNRFHNDDIKYIRKIGEGAFGLVYKASLNREIVAVKVIKSDIRGYFRGSNQTELDRAQNEVSSLSALRHPNIVSLHGIAGEFSQNSVPLLIFEYMSAGSLLKYVMMNDISENQLIKFCLDICEGMKYLHGQSCFHRDLAARNILLDAQGKHAKIRDLGMAIFVKKCRLNPIPYSIDTNASELPKYHTAPECFVSKKFSSASDVWSFGITMCEMFNGGAHPFPDMTPEGASIFISKGQTPLSFMQSELSQAIIDSIEEILKIDRKLRPSFEKLRTKFYNLSKRSFPRIIPSGSTLNVSMEVCSVNDRLCDNATSSSDIPVVRSYRKNQRKNSIFRYICDVIRRCFGRET